MIAQAITTALWVYGIAAVMSLFVAVMISAIYHAIRLLQNRQRKKGVHP